MIGTPKGLIVREEINTEDFETMKSLETLTEYLNCSKN